MLEIALVRTLLDKDFYEWRLDFEKKGTTYTDNCRDYLK